MYLRNVWNGKNGKFSRNGKIILAWIQQFLEIDETTNNIVKISV
jgi:hypothetical protein